MFKSAEIVGPLRVLNSYIGENMLPDIVKGKGVYCVDNLENLKRKAPMVSTSLDLVVRKLPGQVDNQENNQKPPVTQSEINQTCRPYITAIKSKPFLLLAGISGTGKVESFVNWLVLVGMLILLNIRIISQRTLR